MFARQQNERRQGKQKVQTKNKGQRKVVEYSVYKQWKSFGSDLNTLHETPFTPTAFVAGDECKVYVCCSVGWPLIEIANPWLKPKTSTFFSLLPTKVHLKRSTELCPFHLKVFKRQELRNGQLCSPSLAAQWWSWLMSCQGMGCISCWDTQAFPNFSQDLLLLLFFEVGTKLMRI